MSQEQDKYRSLRFRLGEVDGLNGPGFLLSRDPKGLGIAELR